MRIKDWTLEEKVALGIIVWWVGRTFLLQFNPSGGFDAIHAHLWQVKCYLQHGGYYFNPDHTNIALVHCWTLMQRLMFVGDAGATLQYMAYLMSALFLFKLGERYDCKLTGLLAALIYLIRPMNYVAAEEWFTDGFVVMYVLAALWAISSKMTPVVIGLLLGFGCASKITMLLPAILLIALCGRNWWRVALWALIGLAPWYMVNSFEYGNPLFPFKDAWFSWIPWGAHHTPDVVYAYSRQTLPDNWFKPEMFIFWYSNSPIHRVGEMSTVGPWLLATTVCLFAVPLRKWTKPVIVLAWLVGAMYLYWIFGENYFHVRYMLYALALHGLLGAWGVVKLCERQ
jgi:hypothetical protein